MTVTTQSSASGVRGQSPRLTRLFSLRLFSFGCDVTTPLLPKKKKEGNIYIFCLSPGGLPD